MSTKSITVSLSENGLDAAVAWLEGYSKRLEKHITELINKMLDEGETYAANTLGHIDTGETLSTIMGYREGNTGILSVGGNAVWIEFGTGVAYNSEMHPKAAELGMSPHGTYGAGYGANPDGWYYYDENRQRWRHTKGIPQNRFFYNTAQMLRKEYKRMAQEVFG